MSGGGGGYVLEPELLPIFSLSFFIRFSIYHYITVLYFL